METQRRVDRHRIVLGLSAAGVTYQHIAAYLGVGSRQRVQKLLLEALQTLPALARELGVTGRWRRRPAENTCAPVEERAAVAAKGRAPYPSAWSRHIATARRLLAQYGGRYPRHAELMRAGQDALYAYMHKYPSEFERVRLEWLRANGFASSNREALDTVDA